MIKKYRFFTKQKANRILWRIYQRIRDEEVIVRFDSTIDKRKPKLDAWLHVSDKDTMIIIHPDSSVISCFTHEYLHILYVGKKESMILRMEKELISLWSDQQKENLLYKLTKLIRVRPMKLENYDEESYNKLTKNNEVK